MNETFKRKNKDTFENPSSTSSSLYFQVTPKGEIVISATPEELKIIEKRCKEHGINIEILSKHISPCG